MPQAAYNLAPCQPNSSAAVPGFCPSVTGTQSNVETLRYSASTVTDLPVASNTHSSAVTAVGQSVTVAKKITRAGQSRAQGRRAQRHKQREDEQPRSSHHRPHQSRTDCRRLQSEPNSRTRISAEYRYLEGQLQRSHKVSSKGTGASPAFVSVDKICVRADLGFRRCFSVANLRAMAIFATA